MTNHLYDTLLAGKPGERQFAKIPGEPTRYYSYGHVSDVSARFAARLAELDVAPGDRVMAKVPKSIEAVMLYLATVRAGAVFVPLNTAYTAAELEYFLTDAEPTLFVCDPDATDEMALARNLGAKVETLGRYRSPQDFGGSLTDPSRPEAPPAPSVPRGPDDLAAILYTSGTTGRSKGAMLSHENLLSNSVTLAALWGFGPTDTLIHALPIFHTHGLFVATNVALIAGASLLFHEKFDARTVVAAMPQATALMGVPTFYTRLLKEPGVGEAARHMRLFVSGSAPLLAETHADFKRVTGHDILERYGMTETNMITSNPLEGERRAGTVGQPLPGLEVRITKPGTEEILPPGEVGMVEVRGPNVCKGYWRMPDKTAEELRSNGFFITGDLGVFDECRTLTIVGRGKDLIISGGFNVYPKEIETEIDALQGVSESAVIGVPHPDFGEGVVAVVVRQDNATIDETTILATLRDRLARYKQPKHIAFLNELPRNAMGKVQKNVLRDKYNKTFG